MVFYFEDTATSVIYTLSLHDALPIFPRVRGVHRDRTGGHAAPVPRPACHALRVARRRLPTLPQPAHRLAEDRKSTRLNSSHQIISYAVFCLKKKNNSST